VTFNTKGGLFVPEFSHGTSVECSHKQSRSAKLLPGLGKSSNTTNKLLPEAPAVHNDLVKGDANAVTLV
jgi:hypothetical protein